jgi:hypothetical protein
MPDGCTPGLMPVENSVTVRPIGVIRAIRLPVRSVNQTAPSGPAAIPVGALPGLIPAVVVTRAPTGDAPAPVARAPHAATTATIAVNGHNTDRHRVIARSSHRLPNRR